MNDTKEIINDLLDLRDEIYKIQSTLERKICEYMYIDKNNKNDMDATINSDKKYIDELKMMLQNKQVAQNETLEVPTVELNNMENSIEENNNKENIEASNNELTNIEVFDLTPNEQNDVVQTATLNQKTDTWTPPEISNVINEVKVDSMPNLNSQIEQPGMPSLNTPLPDSSMPSLNTSVEESNIPDLNTTSDSIPELQPALPEDNIENIDRGIEYTSSNKFIMPDFL